MNDRVPTENRILAALPPEEYDRLAPHLEPVKLRQGQPLYYAGDRIKHAYFPSSALISLVARLSDGSSAEVGVIGFEGATGIPILLGVNRAPQDCVTQFAGGAARVRADVFRAESERPGALRELLLRYTHSRMFQLAQSTLCYRHHHVEERLARWLLTGSDRCAIEDLPLTHEFISEMLGTRRASVTDAAIMLQAEGFINYRRGQITITDRAGLEGFACECYYVVKAEFDRLSS
jgi:CRP-like cAMP-binding protein